MVKVLGEKIIDRKVLQYCILPSTYITFCSVNSTARECKSVEIHSFRCWINLLELNRMVHCSHQHSYLIRKSALQVLQSRPYLGLLYTPHSSGCLCWQCDPEGQTEFPRNAAQWRSMGECGLPRRPGEWVSSVSVLNKVDHFPFVSMDGVQLV